MLLVTGLWGSICGEQAKLNIWPTEPRRTLATLASQGQLTLSVCALLHHLIYSLCALHQVKLPSPTSYHLPAAFTISPDQARGGRGICLLHNNSFHLQNIKTIILYYHYCPLEAITAALSL